MKITLPKISKLEKAEQSSLSSSKLYEELKKISDEEKQKRAEVIPNTIGLEKINYTAPDSDELMNAAKNSLLAKQAAEKSKVVTDAESKKRTIKQAIEQAVKNYEQSIKNAEESYNNAFKQVENEALKRGIQRSTIALNQIGGLEKGRAESLGELEKSYQIKNENLNSDLSTAEAAAQSALKALEVNQAAEIASTLEKLKKEEAEKEAEALKYNNSITEKEYKAYVENSEKENEELKEIKLKYQRQKISAVMNYFANHDPNQAYIEFISLKDMPEYLGNDYGIVLQALKVRSDY